MQNLNSQPGESPKFRIVETSAPRSSFKNDGPGAIDALKNPPCPFQLVTKVPRGEGRGRPGGCLRLTFRRRRGSRFQQDFLHLPFSIAEPDQESRDNKPEGIGIEFRSEAEHAGYRVEGAPPLPPRGFLIRPPTTSPQPSSCSAAPAPFFFGSVNVLASAGGALDRSARSMGRVPKVPAFPATEFSSLGHCENAPFPWS